MISKKKKYIPEKREAYSTFDIPSRTFTVIKHFGAWDLPAAISICKHAPFKEWSRSTSMLNVMLLTSYWLDLKKLIFYV